MLSVFIFLYYIKTSSEQLKWSSKTIENDTCEKALFTKEWDDWNNFDHLKMIVNEEMKAAIKIVYGYLSCNINKKYGNTKFKNVFTLEKYSKALENNLKKINTSGSWNDQVINKIAFNTVEIVQLISQVDFEKSTENIEKVKSLLKESISVRINFKSQFVKVEVFNKAAYVSLTQYIKDNFELANVDERNYSLSSSVVQMPMHHAFSFLLTGLTFVANTLLLQ